MTDAISIARSSLTAQGQRLAVAANNIANMSTAGPVPGTNAPTAGSGAVYRPLTIQQTSLTIDGEGAGVKATVEEVPENQAYSQVYAPDSVFANEEGMIAVPNISLDEQIINMQIAKTIYKASAKVMETTRRMEDEALNIFS